LNITKLSKKILIVDDNSINRRYATSVLSKAGIKAVDAAGGYEALELLKAESFQLILLDIQMPDLDGFETLNKIKSDFPEVKCPILAITAFYGDDGKTSFIDAGFSDFVRKPIKPEQLIEIVDSWLNKTPHFAIHKNENPSGPIDFSIYNEIKKYAHDSDINDLYIEFDKETTGFLNKLKFLISSKNFPEILSTLHTIKGNSGSLGITDLAVNSERFEADIRSSKNLDLESKLKQLEDNLLHFKQEYKQLLNIE
jgi:CheY-like chemotaxis protein/HPt (histidine-containing phosphotransfer) domain-containing protein